MPDYLITCDDCGLSEGINEAAAALYETGIATDASIMTNQTATQHAMALFAHYPGFRLGIHLNLTDGYPLSRLPRSSDLTTADGRFRSRTHLFSHALLAGRTYRQQIRQELQAQINAFLETGTTPHHLTTHMHFHIVPGLRQIVMELAERYHIPWVRSYHPQHSILPYTRPLQSLLPDPRPAAHPIRTPDYLAGVYFWMEHQPRQLCARLGSLSGRVEIVVHPGKTDDPTFPPATAYAPARRAAESRYITALHLMLRAVHCA
ncbi:MAG: hypothetical protein Kow0077_27130 [Anaerolineae bacterium]